MLTSVSNLLTCTVLSKGTYSVNAPPSSKLTTLPRYLGPVTVFSQRDWKLVLAFKYRDTGEILFAVKIGALRLQWSHGTVEYGFAKQSSGPSAPVKEAKAESSAQTSTLEVEGESLVESGSIHEVSARGDVQQLKAMLRRQPGLISNRNDYDETPLHAAAFSGRKDAVEVLLASNADLESKNGDGMTPLHVAAMGTKDGGLLREGAEGARALVTALGHSDGNRDVAELLLASKADVGARSNAGKTPLHFAAIYGHPNVAKALLENQADVNAVDAFGATPLLYAASTNAQGGCSVVDLLLKNGAEVNAANKKRVSPLGLAAFEGNKKSTELLLASGAHVDARDVDGRTALHGASMKGHEGVAKLLFAAQADLNATDALGAVPLHLAADKNQVSVTELLLASGAVVDIEDKHGYTPLKVAKFNSHTTIVELLLRYSTAVETPSNSSVSVARPAAPPPVEKNARESEEMTLIPAGSFVMGGQGGISEYFKHQVSLDAFYLDKYPVTNAKFKKFVDVTGYVTTAEREGVGKVWATVVVSSTLRAGGMPRVAKPNWKDPEGARIGIADRLNHPVVQVSWHDANAYCKWAGGRLPTEAEYEYAIRGGTTTPWFWGEDRLQSSRYAWSEENSGETTHPVGERMPNPYGLYDIVGNVWEWCSDRWDPKYYEHSPKHNPQGSETGQLRVLRGGSWNYNKSFLTAAARIGNEPGNCDNLQG